VCYVAPGVPSECAVPACPAEAPASMPGVGCWERHMWSYRGRLNVTVSGRACQRWSAQHPHPHTHAVGDASDAGLGDHNYCRMPNPGSRALAVWCYTTSADVEWEYCHVPECWPVCYVHGYIGSINSTESGRPCRPWASQSPHTHAKYTPETHPAELGGAHNYCRNPGLHKERPWCYTTDDATVWEFCDADSCGADIPLNIIRTASVLLIAAISVVLALLGLCAFCWCWMTRPASLTAACVTPLRRLHRGVWPTHKKQHDRRQRHANHAGSSRRTSRDSAASTQPVQPNGG